MPVKAVLQQLHVPDRCKCDKHVPNFADDRRVVVAASEAVLLKHLAKWATQQGKDRCWVYELVSVEPAKGLPVELF